MIKIIIFLSVFLAIHVDDKPTIATWFLQDLEKNIGSWEADNSQYKSEDEPQEKYIMQWQWGIGKTSMTGRMYGIINGKETPNYWEFRHYWDNANNKAMLVQYGNAGVIGLGELILQKDGSIQTIQKFSVPSGRNWSTKHSITNDGKTSLTTSFDKNKQGQWIKNRSYLWHKVEQKEQKEQNEQNYNKQIQTEHTTENNTLDLDDFSLALNVQDLNSSYEFYQKLGFKQTAGNTEQNWMIIGNGVLKIGLFQGFFSKNTLTFNTKDARKIYQHLKEQGIEADFAHGFSRKTGPASFSVSDPDENPILIDQR